MKNYLHQRWRHYTIHLVAKTLGLLVHIDGLPYGRASPPHGGVDGEVTWKTK